MDAASVEMFSPEWCEQHFDHLSPELGEGLHGALAHLRGSCPVAHSDNYGGFWLVTRYADLVGVAQDWETFSSAQGVTVPMSPIAVPIIPEMVDPPLHREYKRLVNAWLSPAIMVQHEAAVRDIANALIDDFIEDGGCELMHDFAKPFPARVFLERFFHAPPDAVPELVRLTTAGQVSTLPGATDARRAVLTWIEDFVEERRVEGPRGDVVDAVLDAEIDGRPITDTEVLAILQLLVFGGLDTTSGALGQMVLRFCREPSIPELIRTNPEQLAAIVEELMRLEGPSLCLARTATRDAEIGGQAISEGDKVLLFWMSANRDDAEFENPTAFDLTRASNRHVGFGIGVHRCAGSHLARMNLRIAIGALVRRLDDLRLAQEVPIMFHPGFTRSPNALELAFAPGPREAP